MNHQSLSDRLLSCISESESNLTINWKTASSSDRAFFEKLTEMKPNTLQTASVEDGENEVWYFKADGIKYRISDNLKSFTKE